jgi:hypothetical protein
MHDTYTDRLSDYVDDEDLSPRERMEIEAHLDTCADCRAVLGELRAVTARAASLVDTRPPGDLWPGIAARIDASGGAAGIVPFRARARRRITFTIPQLIAASLALMVVSGAIVWSLRLAGPRTDIPSIVASDRPQAAQPVPANFADAYYEEAIADLEKTLEAGRNRLDPQTIRVLEENLLAIDRAIDQSRAALAKDPANRFLNTHLASARQRKLALLRSATALASSKS